MVTLSANFRWMATSCQTLLLSHNCAISLSCGVKISAVLSFVSSQSTRRLWQTDAWTDRQNYDYQDRPSIAASRGRPLNQNRSTWHSWTPGPVDPGSSGTAFYLQGSHSLSLKNSRTFQDPRSTPAMFKYKTNSSYYGDWGRAPAANDFFRIYRQIGANFRKFWHLHLHHCVRLPHHSLHHSSTFHGPFTKISSTFQDYPHFPGLSGAWKFYKKKSRTFQKAWEPCILGCESACMLLPSVSTTAI